MVRKSIYIASLEESSGKSVVAIALASIAKELNINVGYFKPIGLGSSIPPGRENIDEDVEVMKSILKLDYSNNILCPLILKRDEYLETFAENKIKSCAEKIAESYKKVSENKEVMLIEGPRILSTGSFLGCPVPKLAKDFNAELLLVARFKGDIIVDEVIQARDYCMNWGTKIFGVILNRIPQDRIERAEHVIKPFIEKNGIKVLGLVPEDKNLSALKVREVCDFIGGRVLAGEDGLDKIIENVLVGAMRPESAAKYFRKTINELVITGGDRTDIILAALETGVSAIVLTGNLYPSVKVFPKADQLKVPLVLVPYDTYTTLQHIQKIIGRIKPKDSRRIVAAINLIKKYVSWKHILQTET